MRSLEVPKSQGANSKSDSTHSVPNGGKIIYVKHLQLDTRHLPEMDKLQLIDVGRLIKDKYLHGSRVKNVDNLCLTPAEGRDTSA